MSYGIYVNVSDGNVFNGAGDRNPDRGQTTEQLVCAKNALTMASCDFKNHLGCQGFDVQCRSRKFFTFYTLVYHRIR